MSIQHILKKYSLFIFFSGCFLISAVYLFLYTGPDKPFNEELQIYDQIWLDYWALLFVGMILITGFASFRKNTKALITIAALSIFGLVAVRIILDGTPFATNAYWGDQKFRTAMVTHYFFTTSFSDMYYKDLPSFYPPVYYFILALIAKIGSIEPYKMLKIGAEGIYLLWPFLLYRLWRNIVTPTQAMAVTIATMLFCSVSKYLPFSAPHAFIGNSAFIAWWLYYIEGIGLRKSLWKYYLWGSVLGGLIFMTYYYGFFLGGLLIIIRLIFRFSGAFREFDRKFNIKNACLHLVGAAIVSTPYWLPLLFSFISQGYDPAQQGWHHGGSTGIALPFHNFSIPGLTFLLGILYALYNYKKPLYRGLLLLLGIIPVFYLLGTLLGALDHPINLIKANEFALVMAGPFLGLFAVSAYRFRPDLKRSKAIVGISVLIILIFFLNLFNSYIKNSQIKTARTARVPSYDFDLDEMKARNGSVFLAAQQELFSFYPIYSFISHNEHYSHPASLFQKRFEMLYLLQEISNPYFVHLALRHNKIQPIDYFMPFLKENQFTIPLALSNYPNKHTTHELKYPASLVENKALFKKEDDGRQLYQVIKDDNFADENYTRIDSIPFTQLTLEMAKLNYLGKLLDQSGKNKILGSLNNSGLDWHSLRDEQPAYSFGGEITLNSSFVVTENDSIHFTFSFQAKKPIIESYRILLHIFRDDKPDQMENYDFEQSRPTKSWRRGDIIFCQTSIPDPKNGFKFFIGFFNKRGVLGKPLSMHYR